MNFKGIQPFSVGKAPRIKTLLKAAGEIEGGIVNDNKD
jgi:hypothetical protein